MWLDEYVLISDTDSYANYSASTYKEHYASTKVSVSGGIASDGAFYDFGDPDYLSTTDYTSLNKNIFIKLENNEKSVCIINDGELECFKYDNETEEIEHLDRIFGSHSAGDYFWNAENSEYRCWIAYGGRMMSCETLNNEEDYSCRFDDGGIFSCS